MKTQLILLLGFVLSFSTLSYAKEEMNPHAKSRKPVFLSADLAATFAKQLPPPPTATSEAQKNDEREILELQKTRTAEECAQAKTEVKVTLKSFYGAPRGSLKDSEVEALNEFAEQVAHDAIFFIYKTKINFDRLRPYLYIKGATPCVAKEASKAYPSGHAMMSKTLAMVLGDLFPADKEKFEARAIEIAHHRVLSGVHHPTDIESGRLLADLFYAELKKSKSYLAAFEAAKAKIQSSSH